MKMTREEQIKDNLRCISERVERAAEKRGVDRKDIGILLATKTVPANEIIYASDVLGYRLAGENRVAELCEKYDLVKDHVDMHMIGHLQTNKVKNVVGKVSLIESVDSIRLAEEINRISEKVGHVTDILAEINIGREEAKGGLLEENVDEFFEKIKELPFVRPIGIMTMAPKCEKKSDYRRYFGKTYKIFLDISEKYLYNIIKPVLSMGMSDSFEEAILEGATEVRVGSAVFGNRIYM